MKQFTKGCNLVQYAVNTTWFCSYEDVEHAPAILQQLFQKLVELSKEHWLIIDAGKIEFIISPDHSKNSVNKKLKVQKEDKSAELQPFVEYLGPFGPKFILLKLSGKYLN